MNLNRFFYGKDWEYKSVFEREKHWRRASYILFFLYGIVILSYIYTNLNFLSLIKSQNEDIDYYRNAYYEELNEEIIVNESSIFERISFDGLNEEQQVKILSVMYSLNERYRPFFNSMIFTNNRTRVNEFCNDKNNHTIGCNSNEGEQIMIYYSRAMQEDNSELRDIICHEVIHTFTKHNKETHKVVYHLGKLEVCFEN